MTKAPPSPDPVPDPDEFPVCDKCGRQHIRKVSTRNGPEWRATCKAHKRGSGLPCGKFPMKELPICEFHGVNPEMLERRETERSRRRAAVALAGLDRDMPPVERIDPFGDLLGLVWKASMAERFWGELVGMLEVPDPRDHIRIALVGFEDDQVPMEVLGDAGAIVGPDRFGELRVHPYVKQWERERTEHARLCKLALDAGVDERLVNLAEMEGQLIAGVIQRVLDAAEVALTPEQRSAAIDVAGRELRGIGGPSAA